MTITVLPMDATAGAPAYSALNARQAQAAVYGAPTGAFSARSGWRVGTATSVVSVTSTTWTLNPCSAMISPAAVLYQGSYGWATSQALTGAVTPADGTNPRLDILYIQISDSSAGDGSGGLSAPVLYLAGAATATPVAPTLPPRSFLVATISVPKAGGGAPTATLNQQYFVAAGAALPVNSQAERDALTAYETMEVIRKDKGNSKEMYTSGAWISSVGQAVAYTPTLGGSTSNPSIGAGSIVGSYVVTGKMLMGQVAINFGSGATTGNGSFYITLPPGFTFAPVDAHIPIGQFTAAVGTSLISGYLRQGGAGNVYVNMYWQPTATTQSAVSSSTFAWASGSAIMASFAVMLA